MKPFFGAVNRIESNDQDVHILVLGDSTGESYSEWAGLFAQWLGNQYPTHTVEWEAYWNSSAEDWGDTRTVSTGTGSYTIKVWVAAGGGWGMSEATAAGVLDHPSAVDYVITYIGANSVTESEWDTGLAAVQSEWPDAYITIGVQHPVLNPYTPPGDWVATALNAVTRGRAAAYGFGWFDAEAWFLAQDAAGTVDLDDVVPDGVHPNAAGSAHIFEIAKSAFLGGGVSSVSILDRAEVLLQAGNYAGSGAWLDESGNGHNATNNGATFLDYDGFKYVKNLNAGAGIITTPNHASLNITGDIGLRCKYQPSSWSPGGAAFDLMRKGRFAITITSYSLGVAIGGYPKISWWDGSSGLTRTSTVSLTSVMTGGVSGWVRADLDVDNGASGHTATFYASTDDGETWTLLDTVITAGTTSIDHTGASVFGFGPGLSYTGSATFVDKWQAMQVYDGDTLVLDAHIEDWDGNGYTFTDRALGAVFTAQHACPLVDRNAWHLTTNDYLEISDDAALDFDASESFTAVAVVRSADKTLSNGKILSKRDGGIAGWQMDDAVYLGNADAYGGLLGDGTNFVGSIGTPGDDTIVDYKLSTVSMKVDRVAQEAEIFVDGVSQATGVDISSVTGSSANAANLLIGWWSGATYFEGQVIAVALFREALTDQEIADVGAALTASYDVTEAALLHGDALWDWILTQPGVVALLSTTDTELVGALNELNGTTGVEYAKARATFLGVPEAG